MSVGLTSRSQYYVAATTLKQLFLAITMMLPVLSTSAWIAPAVSRSSSAFTFAPAFQRGNEQGNGVISKWNHHPYPVKTTVLIPSSSSRMSTAIELSPWSDASSIFLSAEETESWRQFVPLLVSLFVIVDIVLGSPAANSVLGFMRPKEEATIVDDEGQQASRSNNPIASLMNNKSRGRGGGSINKERIDTQAVAQAALDKASATKELRKFLDESKSDWDKMREIQQKMDNDLAQFDENIQRQRTEWEKEINKDATKKSS